MIDLFDTNYANSRLTSSLIRIGKEPILIRSVERSREKYKLFFYSLQSRQSSWTYYPNDDIDFTPVPLGIVNIPCSKDFFVIKRKPARMWKIGLSSNNMKINSHPFQKTIIPSKQTIISSSFLRDTILNNYPSFEKIMSKMKKHPETCAGFNRRFGIVSNGRTINLYHINIGIVGLIDDQLNPILNGEYSFLTEELEKAINNV